MPTSAELNKARGNALLGSAIWSWTPRIRARSPRPLWRFKEVDEVATGTASFAEDVRSQAAIWKTKRQAPARCHVELADPRIAAIDARISPKRTRPSRLLGIASGRSSRTLRIRFGPRAGMDKLKETNPKRLRVQFKIHRAEKHVLAAHPRSGPSRTRPVGRDGALLRRSNFRRRQ